MRGKEEAEIWCKKLAVSEKDFIEKVLKIPFISFQEIFPQNIQAALQAQERNACKNGRRRFFECYLLYQ